MSSETTTTAPWARALAFHTTLPDGSRVRIRPITAADQGRLAQAFERMSPRSRYLRFGEIRPGLSADELRYLTDLDYDNHVAWGAMAADQPGQPGVGAARFVRDRENRREAEFAITVVDAWQGRGLGKVLLQTLMLSAMERDIERLVGYVLPENRSALRLFESFGGQPSGVEDDLLVVEIPVSGQMRTSRLSGAVLPRLRSASRG